MNELHPEKKLYLESEKLVVNHMAEWLDLCVLNPETIEKTFALKESNLKEFKELYGRYAFQQKSEYRQKWSVWRHKLPSGNIWLLSGNKEMGSYYECSKGTEWEDIITFLNELYAQLSLFKELKEKRNNLIQDLCFNYGKTLVDMKEREHVHSITKTESPEKDFLIIACEVWTEIPDWWQSFSEPKTNVREITIAEIDTANLQGSTLKDYVEEMIEGEESYYFKIVLNVDGTLESIEENKRDLSLIKEWESQILVLERTMKLLKESGSETFIC